MMKIPAHVAALAAVSISPWLFAQDDAARKSGAQVSPEYCSISQVLGAKVRMNPGAEARREAEKDGEAAKRPEGKVDDVLVDAQNGGLQYAVVSFGGFIGIGDKTVIVPSSALTWNQAHERFELDASEDRLKALPAFDLKKARAGNLDEACTTAHNQWRAAGTATEKETGDATKAAKEAAAKEASATKTPEAKAVAGTKFFMVPARLVCATDIDDFDVYALNEKFGSVGDLLVDRNGRSIALAVVKRGGALGLGGTNYLVPFRALHICTSEDDRVLCLNNNTAEAETAVVYEKPKNGVVDPEAAKRALASPTFHKGDKDMGDKVKGDRDDR